MNTELTCIIVDDEQEAIDLLQDRLSLLFEHIKITGTYSIWHDAYRALQYQQPDILLLDIFMPEYSGIDLLKLIPNMESEIIFTTAHSEYAINAFEFSASGYILKPIDDKELVSAMNKAAERVKNKKLAKQSVNNSTNFNSKIGIPNGKGIDYFDVNDIIYFEAVNNYTNVVTKNAVLLSSYNIGKYKIMLEGLPFQQVHRSYIINLNCITRYESAGTIILSNKKEIPVARNFKEDFLKLFTHFHSKID